MCLPHLCFLAAPPCASIVGASLVIHSCVVRICLAPSSCIPWPSLALASLVLSSCFPRASCVPCSRFPCAPLALPSRMVRASLALPFARCCVFCASFARPRLHTAYVAPLSYPCASFVPHVSRTFVAHCSRASRACFAPPSRLRAPLHASREPPSRCLRACFVRASCTLPFAPPVFVCPSRCLGASLALPWRLRRAYLVLPSHVSRAFVDRAPVSLAIARHFALPSRALCACLAPPSRRPVSLPHPGRTPSPCRALPSRLFPAPPTRPRLLPAPWQGDPARRPGAEMATVSLVIGDSATVRDCVLSP